MDKVHTFVANGLSKSFGQVHALHDVSLSVSGGEVVALMGENGAGKSTLLKIISGDHAADAGEILLDGRARQFRNAAHARRAGVRVVAQEPEIIPDVTVAENIYVGALGRSGRVVNQRSLERRARRALDENGFGHVLDPGSLGRSLSPAQRQIVEIMRVLIDLPDVIAFDEPTSSLTENEVEALFALIGRLRSEGKAIIYVSHRMPEIFRLADSIVVLRDGRMAGTRATAATTEQEIVNLMVGRNLDSLGRKERVITEEVVLAAEGLVNEHLRGISLHVRRGEVLGIAGLIGAGRSELARTLVGDLPLDEGVITLNGIRLTMRSPQDAVRAGIGLAPEERKAQALLMQRSVRDNMSLAILDRLSRRGVVRTALERRVVSDLVTRLRVRTPHIEQHVNTLSGGNQQKVVLGRWLARTPHLLILDEPTRGVDVGAKAEIYTIIEQLVENGMAIIVISSELPEVIHLSDRILVMEGGRITGELDHAEATEQKLLALALPDREPVGSTGGHP